MKTHLGHTTLKDTKGGLDTVCYKLDRFIVICDIVRETLYCISQRHIKVV